MQEELDKYCEAKLFSKDPGTYGKSFQEHYLKQYEAYVHSIGHNSDTRQRINSYFLTLNTLLLTAMGVSFAQHVPFISSGGQIAIPFVGIIVCFVWWAISFSYKQRSIAKQKILQCMEKNLPLAPYSVEWEVLKDDHVGLKFHFFRISLVIPWIFALLYFFILFFSF